MDDDWLAHGMMLWIPALDRILNPLEMRPHEWSPTLLIDGALSNDFGFGVTNATLIFRHAAAMFAGYPLLACEARHFGT
jgi:3-oxoacyl-(acyl-carrier-protein) synthase